VTKANAFERYIAGRKQEKSAKFFTKIAGIFENITLG
jgi:hypothetical protein